LSRILKWLMSCSDEQLRIEDNSIIHIVIVCLNDLESLGCKFMFGLGPIYSALGQYWVLKVFCVDWNQDKCH